MTKDAMGGRALVSVVLATFNEMRSIAACIASLCGQQTPDFDLEILAVDGVSDDGTREYLDSIAAMDSRVRVLVNEKRKAPFAFNLGLSEARGEFVCILGAHAVYAPDYISVCLNELIARDVVGCGGRVLTRPAADTLQARLVASALGHPFGSSRNSVRTRAEGYWDAAYMVLRKNPLIEIGGYSKALSRNQDNDTYQRMRAKGYRFFCTGKTQCVYFPKETIRKMLEYAFRTGFWNAISLEQNSASMSWRHFAPFIFVASLLIAALGGISGLAFRPPLGTVAVIPFVAIIVAHLLTGSFATMQLRDEEKFQGDIALPFVFLGFHFWYGLGTAWAFLTWAKRNPRVTQTAVAGSRLRKMGALE